MTFRGDKLSNKWGPSSRIFLELNLWYNDLILQDGTTSCTYSISSSWVYVNVSAAALITNTAWHHTNFDMALAKVFTDPGKTNVINC